MPTWSDSAFAITHLKTSLARACGSQSCHSNPLLAPALGDRLVGMIAQRDLLAIDLSEKDEEIRWLNAYIHFIPPVKEGTS